MFLDLGGTFRALSAEDTLARLKPLLPIFGITRVAAHENLGNLKIPVSVCFRPNSRLLSTSQGKGVTRALADVSAIMESIEAFHAERLPPADVISSAADLRRAGTRFVDPAALAQLPRQSLYSEHEPVGWLTLKRLADGAPILAPRAFLNMHCAERRTEIATLALVASSNGLASGNTPEEALVHGLYELIERHSIFEYRHCLPGSERAGRAVDLDSLRSVPHLAELLARIDEAELNVWVRAIHGPLGVPAFGAIVGEKVPLRQRTKEFPGWGAHYVPEVALSRAITEAVQCRITYISGSRDDLYPWHYVELDSPSEDVVEEPDAHRLHLDELPSPPRFSSFAEVLQWTLALLERHGFQDTCYFDHQRPQYGNIPVVSVVSPNVGYDIRALHSMERR
jgi:ribosomal protein S12 methylthiotransferase accessory factor